MSNQFKQANSPSVSRINIEYTDGSLDTISLIQGDDLPIYNLIRKRANAESISLGAHTSGAIAALLFITSISNLYTEYSSSDPKVVSLLRCWTQKIKSI